MFIISNLIPMQCTTKIIISNATCTTMLIISYLIPMPLHNYAYLKQCNPNALHNYAYHNQCNPNALHN